ncbi:hypothetical protein [Pseudomonas phage Itty13]|uniref:Uncharacterized protein n=1 Tax=Pseudomonas phage Itty13 TaxID=2805750 RepID=A0A889IQZ0_9CAUD|nr:hypothetical protein PQC19_gp44 [Pseudomonas phage Itty13]QRE00620.1 hypothetical protein [Pseudomonas phage Itty13]
MLKRIRIYLLKRSLKASYTAYMEALESRDCGRELADSLPSVSRHRERCNVLLSKLRRLDPAAPLPSRIN